MTGAIVGSALIGGAASIAGGKAAGKGAAAAGASTAAAQVYSTDIQQEMFKQTRADQAPWRLAGERALQAIETTPDFQFTIEDFETFKDPAYEFRMEEGINALDRSAAARGRLLSGAQDKAITRYGSRLASEEFSNAFNRSLTTRQANLAKEQSLAGIGQTATNVVAQAGQQTARDIAGTTMAGTQAQNAFAQQGAQAQTQMYSGLAQTAQSGISNYLLYKQMQPTVAPAAAPLTA